MGFLGLIPASAVAAAYNVCTHKLTLFASGSIQESTYGISFHRAPLMGGLKFLLEGWTGPFTGHESTYTHSQDFDIQLPNRATPSGTVIIVDATDPNGKVVPIHFLGGIVPPHLEPRDEELKSIAAPVRELPQAPAAAEAQSVLSPPHQVTVAVLGQAFGISEGADR
ncbi:MAG: hypothetical protein FRX48_03436 [Lasallia pustulata]|uniref:Uncharacterized protein n=1 Tax=Lasallia pustulata TaxID=136370 RepID=A0A5M8PTV8_9LECA|nr:MAG: hypothetical protein FRX48_03436 [Lasallia pustulata]